jgi:hypothetical protein
MPLGAGAGNGIGQGLGVHVADVYQFNPILMFFDSAEMIGGNTTAPHQGQANLAVGDGLIVMHWVCLFGELYGKDNSA